MRCSWHHTFCIAMYHSYVAMYVASIEIYLPYRSLKVENFDEVDEW